MPSENETTVTTQEQSAAPEIDNMGSPDMDAHMKLLDSIEIDANNGGPKGKEETHEPKENEGSEKSDSEPFDPFDLTIKEEVEEEEAGQGEEEGKPKEGEEKEPSSNEHWQKAKQKHADELATVRAEVDQIKKERDEAVALVSKIGYRFTPEYKKKFVEPTQNAVAAVKSIAGDHEDNQTLKSVVQAMEAGTLTRRNFPDISKGLNPMEQNAVMGAAQLWLQTRDAQAVADEAAEKGELDYAKATLVGQQEMQAKAKQQALAEVGKSMEDDVFEVFQNAQKHLPAFQDADREAVAKLMAGDKGEARKYIAKAVALAPSAFRQLREALQTNAALEKKLKDLEGRLSDQSNASSMRSTTTSSAFSNQGSNREQLHENLMDQIDKM